MTLSGLVRVMVLRREREAFGYCYLVTASCAPVDACVWCSGTRLLRDIKDRILDSSQVEGVFVKRHDLSILSSGAFRQPS